MKIRSGFVSNSSSSSFVVAAKEEDAKITVNVEIDLKRYVGSYGSILKTKEEVDAHMLDKHCYDTLEEMCENEPYLKKQYDKMLKALDEGKVIYSGSCSDDGDDPMELYLCYNGFSDFESEYLTVIESEGGY